MALRYLYAVALKDRWCRGYDYLTCGDAYEVFKALLTDVDDADYQFLARNSPDRQSAIAKRQIQDGLNEIFFHTVTVTTYFRQD